MKMIRYLKTTFIFLICAPNISCLKPGKLPSGKDRVYKYNREHPENDLKNITPAVASFVSRHWLNNILQPTKICQEDAMIVEKINSLEQYIQDQFTHENDFKVEYLAWTPQGITEDILFLIILEQYEEKNVLRTLINSPVWESKQISNECLLESLICYSSNEDKVLDIEPFLTNNIRYKLLWKDFNVELI